MLRRRTATAASTAARRFASLAGVTTKPGTQLHGFTVLRTKAVPELELEAVHLRHDATGAEHLHIAREDCNNVFSIGFKTNAPDDSGVPHILEHTTLCGSAQYPVRDPFFKMLPRTLSNFMNAFTAADHTFYPFATTNAQDYRNLLSVYLDATLHPLLTAGDFAQEGWRIGPAGAAGDGPLAFKGVVYNEMKGQMSDAGYLFYIRFQDHIFPALHNSGGDPARIPDLTHAALRQFHAAHYHPSNAKLFTYGNQPLDAHLAALNARLQSFAPSTADAEIRRPLDLTAGPQSVVVEGPQDPMVDAAKQCKTSLTWTLGDTADVVESFALALVAALLTDGYGSPLYRGLIESGLGTDWSANTGYDSSGRVGLFSVGLTGVAAADVPRVGEAIRTVLQQVRTRGFERSKIDGHLHQLELGLKHKTASFGVALLQRLQPKWFAGVDPFAALAWNETLAAFEQRLAAGDYLEGLVDRYLLGGNAFSFTMQPAADYEAGLAADEAARLAAKVDEATAAAGGDAEKARAQLAEREAALLAAQTRASSEDLSCLPSVHVADIPRQAAAATTALREATAAHDTHVQWRAAPTNGLTYLRAVQTLALPDDLRPLVPLFADAVQRLGTRTLTTEQLEDRLKLTTGGVSVGYHAAPSPTSTAAVSEGLVFSGTALDRNVPAMLDLLWALVRETDFDSPAAAQQVRQLLQAAADGVVSDIAASGHSFARRRAEAALTPAARLREQVSGLAQVRLIGSLAARPPTPGQLDDVLARLKQIQQRALAAGGLRVAVTCGAESARANETALDNFLARLPTTAPSTPSTPTPSTPALPARTYFPLPYQVSYGALVLPSVPYAAPAGAALQVLAQLLTHKHLHHEIREKGGAYGGGAYASALEGVFGFYAYRDPNPRGSLATMRGAGAWAAARAWTAADLEEAKLSVFQGVDAPRAVSDEGMGQFLYGITDAMRQQRRERLLDVGADDVRAAAEQFLVGGLAQQAERAVVLGPAAEWATAADGWTVEQLHVGEGAEEA